MRALLMGLAWLALAAAAHAKPAPQPKPQCRAIVEFGRQCLKLASGTNAYCRVHHYERKPKDLTDHDGVPTNMVQAIIETHNILKGTNGVFVVIESGKWMRLAGVAADSRTVPFIDSFCAGREATLEYDTIESRSRSGKRKPAIVYVFVEGKMLNTELIRQGLAGWESSPKFWHRYREAFESAENEAYAARRGLWKEIK